MSYEILNNKGFSLTEALISAALLGTVFLGVFIGVQKISDHQHMGAQLQSTELIKNSLYSVLSNPTAWENTWMAPENAVFNCMSNDSCAGKSGYLNVVKLANNTNYFEDNGRNGFKANGMKCEYNPSNPAGCFITTKLKVTFLCDADCKSPLAKIDGSFYLFGTNTNSTSLNSLNFQLIKAVKSDPCAVGCRTVTYDPSLAKNVKGNLNAEILKIILVVDNSGSMKAAQQYLNNGLQKLLSKLRNLNIESKIYIYTTTQLNKDGDYAVADDNTYYYWEDVYGVPHEGSKSPYIPSTLDFERITSPTLNTPAGGSEIALSKDITDSDFGEISTQIENILTSSSGIGIQGSSDEQGLCTVAKTLFDTSSNQFLSDGDNVLFLIVSDEDDISEKECFAKKSEKRNCDEKLGGYYTLYGCSQSDISNTCDYVQYNVYEDSAKYFKANRSIFYTCKKEIEKDGEPIVIDDYEAETSRKWTGRCSEEPYGSGICNTADISQIKVKRNDCNGENDAITNCKTWCWESNTQGEMYTYRDYDKSTMGKNIISSSFKAGGATYPNLITYMEKKYPGKSFLSDTYRRYGYGWVPKCEQQSDVVTSYQELMGLDPNNTTLKQTIKQKADSMFGPDGYSMSLIINDKKLNKAAGCGGLEGEQSYGEEYKRFAESLEISGAVSSICSSDYSEALDNVSKFAENVAANTVKTITLEKGEKVLEITTTDSQGNKVMLSTPDDYYVKGLVITFTDEFMKTSNNSVEVKMSMEPPSLNLEQPKWMKSAQSN